MRVIHVTTGLETGGAEIMLAKLSKCLNQRKIEQVVVSLMDPGAIANVIRASGIEVVSLSMKRGRPSAGATS